MGTIPQLRRVVSSGRLGSLHAALFQHGQKLAEVRIANGNSTQGIAQAEHRLLKLTRNVRVLFAGRRRLSSGGI